MCFLDLHRLPTVLRDLSVKVPFQAKANSQQKGNDIMAKYSVVYIYTKKGNLLPYLTGKIMHDQSINTTGSFERAKEYYARERSLELIAMFRFENGKTFCKIKCPVNPLPVKGEFEVPAIGVLHSFLNANEWHFKQAIYPKMFE